MVDKMAYRGLRLMALVGAVGLGGCPDDDGIVEVPDGGNVDAPFFATRMYVGPDGIGQENNPQYDGLSEDFPIATLTEALRRRFSAQFRQYREVNEIVLRPGEYFRNESFPIEVRLPTNVPELVIRGGATAVERVTLRNDAVLTPVAQRIEPLLRLSPGVRVENMTIENRYTDPNCLGLLYTVLLDRGEFASEPVTFRNVTIKGGSKCHSHIAVGSNTTVDFSGEIVIDMNDAAGGVTTSLGDQFASGATINFTGPTNRNCTGIRFLNAGPNNPVVALRGPNEVLLDQVCMRPGTSPGERTAVFIRGETNVTIQGLEVQTADGSPNATRFSFGVRHSPAAGATGTLDITGATLDIADTGIFLNGGQTTVTDAAILQGQWGIVRQNGDFTVRRVEFDGLSLGGIQVLGRATGTIALDLGTGPLGGDDTDPAPGRNVWRFQGEEGAEGDVRIEFEEAPTETLTIQALGQRAWSPTISTNVVCRGQVQQDDFNIDVRTPNVRVEHAPGAFCEGYDPPSGT